MKIKYILPVLFGGALLGSCTNLDETVYSLLPREDFLNDPNLFYVYSGKAYSTLQNYCTEQSLWTLNLQAGDECAVPIAANGWWNETRYQEVQKHEFPVSNKFFRTAWDFVFNGISSCNDVIYELESSSLQFPDRDNIIAQVKLLRALYYFWGADAWGNIPFATDPNDKSSPPQKGRDFIVPWILTEITDNIGYLDDTPSSTNYGRFTQGAANALLAKVYLNYNEWLGQAKWAEAEAACLAVIESGKYAIEERYKMNFEMGNEASRENMLSIPYSSTYTSGDSSAFPLYFFALDQFVATNVFNIGASVWDGFICQPDFIAKYEPGDTRSGDTFIYGKLHDPNGNVIKDPETGQDYEIDPWVPEDTFPGTGNNLRNAKSGARIWKWSYQTDGTLRNSQTMISMGNHFALLRYSDVLYMYAEALLRQSKSTAAIVGDADFQKIRTRAGLAPFAEGTLTLPALLAERGSEFGWEGWRRNDLIRFGEFSAPWWGKPTASDATRKLFPLPEERRLVNPNLLQNPGY